MRKKNGTTELPFLARQILDDSINHPTKYPYLFNVSEADQQIRRAPRKAPVIDREKIDYYDKFSFLDLCMENELVYEHEFTDLPNTTVYILGTDHEHKSSAYNIKTLFEYIKPDIMAVEDYMSKEKDPDGWDTYQKMMKIVNSHDCNMESIIRQESRESLIDAFLFPNIDDEDDNQQVNPYGDFLLSLGHLNNVDSLVPYYLCQKRNLQVECIDIDCDTFYNFLEHEDASIYKVEAIKYWYGLDCDAYPTMFDVDNVNDLIEACVETPMCGWLELSRQLEKQYNPEGYLFETHARDIHMVGKLQEICKNNPGKTIVCLVGADHMLGMFDLFHRKIPKGLISAVAKCKDKNKLFKKLAKFGATKTGSLIEHEYLPWIGVYSQESESEESMDVDKNTTVDIHHSLNGIQTSTNAQIEKDSDAEMNA